MLKKKKKKKKSKKAGNLNLEIILKASMILQREQSMDTIIHQINYYKTQNY